MRCELVTAIRRGLQQVPIGSRYVPVVRQQGRGSFAHVFPSYGAPLDHIHLQSELAMQSRPLAKVRALGIRRLQIPQPASCRRATSGFRIHWANLP